MGSRERASRPNAEMDIDSHRFGDTADAPSLPTLSPADLRRSSDAHPLATINTTQRAHPARPHPSSKVRKPSSDPEDDNRIALLALRAHESRPSWPPDRARD
jgi:hypothetical protein